MAKDKEQKAKCKRQSWELIKINTLLVILCVICFLLSFSYRLNAQLQGAPIAYVDVITEDEEGDRIHFPSFVFTEPVMKEIYVIDSGSRIIVYTSDFFPLYTLDKRKGIVSPLSLIVDEKGNLYVVQVPSKNNKRYRISVFNACFRWKRDIYLKGFEGAESIIINRLAIDKKGNIYIVSQVYPGAIVLNSDGEFIDVIKPEEGDKKVILADITIDKNGRIYLVSEIEGRIYVYDENRKFLFKFGEKGGSTGKLSRPVAVAVDNKKNRIFVVDYMRHTVSAYNGKDGKYLFEFGGLGWGEGWFHYPKDIDIDSNGRIFVADTFNDRIEVFQSNSH